MEHHCHARGCKTPVPPRLLMCALHWKMVPKKLKRPVWIYFNPRQCSSEPDRPAPTRQWFEAADAAIEFVAELEREQEAAKVQQLKLGIE